MLLLSQQQLAHAAATAASLWTRDAIWLHRFGSTFAQGMACCLTAPSHYLNQYWLIISLVVWHTPDGNIHWKCWQYHSLKRLKNDTFEITTTSPQEAMSYGRGVVQGGQCISNRENSFYQTCIWGSGSSSFVVFNISLSELVYCLKMKYNGIHFLSCC